MSLMKTTMFAAAAVVAAMGASGAVATAEAKHGKHGKIIIVKPHHVKHHHRFVRPWYPPHVSQSYACHWSPKMQTYGIWKYGVFIPCYW